MVESVPNANAAPSASSGSRRLRFGIFEADLRAGELSRNGVKIRIYGQPFAVLAVLLERPAEVVTREELQRKLWPNNTFVDFEHGLNKAINKLREALDDDADNPRYIETLPRRGYRFVGTLSPAAPPAASPAESPVGPMAVRAEGLTTAPPAATAPHPRLGRRTWRALGLWSAVACAAGVAAFFWSLESSAPPPRVLSYQQLTSDRLLKGVGPCGWPSRLVTDGPRVYFGERRASVAQVSVGGGAVVTIATPYWCFLIEDISPDKTELLGESFSSSASFDMPLWRVSIAAGEAQRVGNLIGHEAAWSPDGKDIAFATDPAKGKIGDVYIAKYDGADARRVATINRYVDGIRWSPNGRTLRMIVSGQDGCSVWDVSADGTRLHRLALKMAGDRNPSQAICDVSWTPDGRYSLFTVGGVWGRSTGELWARREGDSAFRRAAYEPVRLTSGPVSFSSPAASADGRHIYAIGDQDRGELVRYDLTSGHTESFLSGISAEQLDFSPDGKWIVYASFPEHALWRSRADGSERILLTTGPVWRPRWSPGGTRIAFSAEFARGPLRLYVMPAGGGKPELVVRDEAHDGEVDPVWAPDESALIFGGGLWNVHGRINSVDLRTGHVTGIPGSEGMFAPGISPDGRFITANDRPGKQDKRDQVRQRLFDRQTQQWSELSGAQSWDWTNIGVFRWASDSRHVYALVPTPDDQHQSVYRLGVVDRSVERVASVELPDRLTGTWTDSGWMGFAPDGSILALRDRSVHEIYALEVDLP